MKFDIYSHHDGEHVVDQQLKRELFDIINETKFKFHVGCGNLLRTEILTKLKLIGWTDEFRLNSETQISLTAGLDDHVLSFQTGNMSRFYADLLKLEYVFKKGKVVAAFYLIPTKDAASFIGSNVAYFERLIFEMQLYKDIVTIPTLVIGLNQ